MLYFAYGSNMDWKQMKERCPSVKFIGKATLPNHRLAFPRTSGKRGCGVADAVPAPDSTVWGVIYDVPMTEIGLLDRSEGFNPGKSITSYKREQRHVFLDGDEKQPICVEVYFAIHQQKPQLPNIEYKSLILSGARLWQLPEDYIRDVLEPIEVQ